MADSAHSGSLLTIDLDAIGSNYRRLVNECREVEVSAVVKADAYGLGVDRVAPALARHGCKTFFVANLDEAIMLRELLPDVGIHVLDGMLGDSGETFVEHRLVPVLNTEDELVAWRASVLKSEGRPPADIQIDTGMCRLGIDVAILGDDTDLADFNVDCLISHLACSEDADNPLNERQLQAFTTAAAHLNARRASLAASSGVFLGPRYHFDMVRGGVALFGANPTPGGPNPMAQVLRMQGKILQVRRVDTPQTVGYGASHRITQPSRIATIPIGYADGYMRSLGNTGVAFIDGIEVPVVGRISMDLITLDVTGVPEDLARPGAYVELIGESVHLDDVAERAGTIGYEILTRMGSRFERRYIETISESA